MCYYELSAVLGMSYLHMFVTVCSCILLTGSLSITSTVIYPAVIGYVTEVVKGIILFKLYHVRYLKWTMITLAVMTALKMKATR
jgi:hypothetical protein